MRERVTKIRQRYGIDRFIYKKKEKCLLTNPLGVSARARGSYEDSMRDTHTYTRARVPHYLFTAVSERIFSFPLSLDEKRLFFFFKLVGGQKMGGQTPLIEYIRASLSYGSSTSPISQPLKFSDFRFLFPAFLSL